MKAVAINALVADKTMAPEAVKETKKEAAEETAEGQTTRTISAPAGALTRGLTKSSIAMMALAAQADPMTALRTEAQTALKTGPTIDLMQDLIIGQITDPTTDLTVAPKTTTALKPQLP